MIDREIWQFKPEWLAYVNRSWKGKGRVELVTDDSIERLEFQEQASLAFSALGFKHKKVKTWVSVQLPESGEGYAEGYPHYHYPLSGLTLVHYLDPGDKPAPLDIFIRGVVVETIYPEPGLTVFMPNNLSHGARKNNGTKNRIQLIATGLK